MINNGNFSKKSSSFSGVFPNIDENQKEVETKNVIKPHVLCFNLIQPVIQIDSVRVSI